MKNLYQLSIASVALILGTGAGLHAQSTHTDRMQVQSITAPAGQPALQYASPATTASSASCDSLTTTYLGGNNNSGIMFNIKALANTAVTGFHVSINNNAGLQTYIKLYYRKGSYLGNESTPSAWTFVDSVQVTSGGTGVPVYVPMNTSIVIPAGQKYGFYITTNNNTFYLDYTDGVNEDSVYIANSYFQVREGRGMGYPFSMSGVPRVFNGSIHYCPALTATCDTLRTTYAAGNGNDGAMFDITAVQNVMLKKVYTSVVGEGWMKVYYHNGSYSGYDTNPGAWTLLDSAYVSPISSIIPTLINVKLDLPVNSGQTAALYVTGNGSGASVDYTNGTTEGSVYTSDAYIQVKEGRGITYPFAGSFFPRIFNGTLDYCPVSSTGINDMYSNSNVSIYPNPFSNEATLAIGKDVILDNASLHIYDLLGKEVMTVSNISSNTISLQKGMLQNGVYIYRLSTAAGTAAMGRFTVE